MPLFRTACLFIFLILGAGGLFAEGNTTNISAAEYFVDTDPGEGKLTNIGLFRVYVEAYLKAHKLVRQDMTCIVRQLAPHECGVPIEIYVFISDIRWREFESIQSDIFDHLFAILPEFNLSAYQRPSSSDLSSLSHLSD